MPSLYKSFYAVGDISCNNKLLCCGTGLFWTLYLTYIACLMPYNVRESLPTQPPRINLVFIFQSPRSWVGECSILCFLVCLRSYAVLWYSCSIVYPAIMNIMFSYLHLPQFTFKHSPLYNLCMLLCLLTTQIDFSVYCLNISRFAVSRVPSFYLAPLKGLGWL